jgi:hypothetical protein
MYDDLVRRIIVGALEISAVFVFVVFVVVKTVKFTREILGQDGCEVVGRWWRGCRCGIAKGLQTTWKGLSKAVAAIFF